MILNIVIGAVLAALLLFDFVYLPAQRERETQNRSTAAADPPRPPAAGAANGPLATSDQGKTGRVEALEKQLGGEHARALDLERDLAEVRDQLSRADSARATAEAAQHGADAALADAQVQREADRRLARDLAERLAAAERDGAARLADLAQGIDRERARSIALERDLAAARDQLSRSTREGSEGQGRPAGRDGADIRPAPAPRSTAGDDGTKAPKLPPDGMPPRVVMRYWRGDAAARDRAAALKSILHAQGLDVGDQISRSQEASSDSITYYYDNDRDSAERIATIMGSSKPVKVKIPKAGTIRPGRVDVAFVG